MKLVRRLLEEQDKVPRSYFARRRAAGGGGGGGPKCKRREYGTCMREDGARGPWPSDQILKWETWKLGFFRLLFSLAKFVRFVVN